MRHALWALSAIVLPNAAFICVALWLGIERPLLNVDYAFVLLLLACGWRVPGLVLAALFLVVDVVNLSGQVLPFMRLADLWYLLGFIGSASLQHQLILAAVVGLLLALLLLIFIVGRETSRTAALVLFNVLIISYALQANLFDTGQGRFYRAPAGEWVASQTVNLWQRRSDGFLESFAGDPVSLRPGAQGATAPWFAALAQGQTPARMLLIVNESWGVPQQERIQAQLLEPLLKLPRAQVRQGRFGFNGATLAGELRELCHLRADGFNLRDVEQGFADCLPNLLRRRGYSTFAMHGAMSLLYERKYWYPRAGFDQSLFYEGLIGGRRCFSFPGACDLDLRARVGEYFSHSGPRFAYWLTLNSHPPYDLRDLVRDDFDCADVGVDAGSEVCRNLKLQAQFFNGLAELLQTPEMAEVEVIVVGDHPPVLINAHDRDRHFIKGQVPWIYLKTGAVQ